MNRKDTTQLNVSCTSSSIQRSLAVVKGIEPQMAPCPEGRAIIPITLTLTKGTSLACPLQTTKTHIYWQQSANWLNISIYEADLTFISSLLNVILEVRLRSLENPFTFTFCKTPTHCETKESWHTSSILEGIMAMHVLTCLFSYFWIDSIPLIVS